MAEQPRPRRRAWLGTALSFLLLDACEAKNRELVLDVVLFSYLDRPIFDVFIDGKAGESSGVYPETGGSTIAGVRLALGPKTVTWRLDGPQGMARNGDTVSSKNALQLNAVVAGARYLAIHIYPDDTVELASSVHFPQPSARGEVEIATIRKKQR